MTDSASSATQAIVVASGIAAAAGSPLVGPLGSWELKTAGGTLTSNTHATIFPNTVGGQLVIGADMWQPIGQTIWPNDRTWIEPVYPVPYVPPAPQPVNNIFTQVYCVPCHCWHCGSSCPKCWAEEFAKGFKEAKEKDMHLAAVSNPPVTQPSETELILQRAKARLDVVTRELDKMPALMAERDRLEKMIQAAG